MTGSRPSPQIRPPRASTRRSEEHTSELQSQSNLVCRLLLEKKKNQYASQSGEKLCANIHSGGSSTDGCSPLDVGDSRHGVLACAVHRFFLNDTATTEIYTLSLHDALPI